LKQYLSINYDDMLESEATPADDVEGTLYRFIPPDYTKSEIAFAKVVEEDAVSFKPLGEKIGSYVQQAASVKGKEKGKGKGKANGSRDVVLGEEDEGVVVYEMYKVNALEAKADLARLRGQPRGLGSITGECSFLSCCSSRGEAMCMYVSTAVRPREC
jgi:hypothetical protein